MGMRHVLWPLLATLVSAPLGAESSTCPFSCPPCPAAPACLAPHCPPPVCPPLPAVPPCPAARCPAPPEGPACPTPELHLSCPHPTCPPQSCPSCPACPNASSCPACSSPSAPSPPASPPSNVPPDYVYKPGRGAYKWYSASSASSWLSANRTCSQDGGYLAIPKNRVEMLMLIGLGHGILLHVGFYRKNNVFLTALDQPMTEEQTSLWRIRFPRSHHSCAYLSPSSKEMLSESCSDSESYICEIPLV